MSDNIGVRWVSWVLQYLETLKWNQEIRLTSDSKINDMDQTDSYQLKRMR